MKPWTFATCASAGAQHVKPVSVALEGQRLQTVLKQKNCRSSTHSEKLLDETVHFASFCCPVQVVPSISQAVLLGSLCSKVPLTVGNGSVPKLEWERLPKQQPESQNRNRKKLIQLIQLIQLALSRIWDHSGLQGQCFVLPNLPKVREAPRDRRKDREFLERSLRSLRSSTLSTPSSMTSATSATSGCPSSASRPSSWTRWTPLAAPLLLVSVPKCRRAKLKAGRERQRKIRNEMSKKETNGGKTI